MFLRLDSKSIRIASALIAFIFSLTTVAWSVPEATGISGSSMQIEPSPDFNFPSDLGTVQRIFLADSNLSSARKREFKSLDPRFRGDDIPKRFVVYIQDAHADPEAQKNIQALIAYFQKKFAVSSILAEGASGEADLSGFRNFPDKDLTTEVADQFLKTAEITGFEYAAITSMASLRLIGLEDPAVYEKHVKVYAENQKVLEKNRKISSNQIKELEKEKKKVYNKRLYEFDQILSRNDSLVQFNRIIPYLARRARELGIDFDHLASVRTLLRMQVIEGILNLPWQTPAKADRDRCVKKLNELQETLRPDVLFRQTEELKARVKENLFRNAKERDLDHRAGFAEMLNRLIDLKLSPEDWKKYKVRSRGVPPRIAGQDARPTRSRARNPAILQSFKIAGSPQLRSPDEAEGNDGLPFLDLSAAEEFYQLALERDTALAKNLLRQLESIDRAFLITGGFHGPALEDALEKAGISFVSIYPGVSESPDLRHYAERMSGDMKTLAAAPTMAPLMFSEHTLMPRLLTFEPAFQRRFIAIRENRYRSSAVRLNQTGLKLAGFGNSFGATSFTVEVKDQFGRDDITLDQPFDPFSYRWVYLKKVIAHDDPDFLLHSLRRAASNETLNIADVTHVEMRRIQYGMYHDVFKVEVSVKKSAEPVLFAILLTRNPNANKATVEDYENLVRLRSRFPAFAHYLQDPIALHDADGIEGYSMYSAVWIDDYYEISAGISDPGHTLQINDLRTVDERGESVYGSDVVIGEDILTSKWTRELIRSAFRLLTVFYDEETGEAILPNLMRFVAGDIMAHKSFTDPRDVKLVTVRQIGKFTVREFLDAMVSQEIPSGSDAGFNMHFGVPFAKERAMGIIDGLVEKYGRDKGLVVARRWALESSRFSPVLTEALASTGFGAHTPSAMGFKTMTVSELLKNIKWWSQPSLKYMGLGKKRELEFLLRYISDDMNLFWKVAQNEDAELPGNVMAAFRLYYGLEDGVAHSRDETARSMGSHLLPHNVWRKAHLGLKLLFLVAAGGPGQAYEILSSVPQEQRPKIFAQLLVELGRLQAKVLYMEALRKNRPLNRTQMDEQVDRITRELNGRIHRLAEEKIEGGYAALIERLIKRDLGLAKSYFSGKFQKRPSIRAILAVAAEFNVSIDELFGTENFRVKLPALEKALLGKANAAARIRYLDQYSDLSLQERETLVRGVVSMNQRFRRKRSEFIQLPALLKTAFLRGISPGQLIGSVKTKDYEPIPEKHPAIVSANGVQIELKPGNSRTAADEAAFVALKMGSVAKLKSGLGQTLTFTPADLLTISEIEIHAKSDRREERLKLDVETVDRMLGAEHRYKLEINPLLIVSVRGSEDAEGARSETLSPGNQAWRGDVWPSAGRALDRTSPRQPRGDLNALAEFFEIHWSPETLNLTVVPLGNSVEVEVRATFLKEQVAQRTGKTAIPKNLTGQSKISRVSVREATQFFLPFSMRARAGFGAGHDLEIDRGFLLGELNRLGEAKLVALENTLRFGVAADLFDRLPHVVSARGFLQNHPIDLEEDLENYYPRARQYIYDNLHILNQLGVLRNLDRFIFFNDPPPMAMNPLKELEMHVPEHVRRILGLDLLARKTLMLSLSPQDQFQIAAVEMKNPHLLKPVLDLIRDIRTHAPAEMSFPKERGPAYLREEITNAVLQAGNGMFWRHHLSQLKELLTTGVHPELAGETGFNRDRRRLRDFIIQSMSNVDRRAHFPVEGKDPRAREPENRKYLFFPSRGDELWAYQMYVYYERLLFPEDTLSKLLREYLGIDFINRHPAAVTMDPETVVGVEMKFPERMGDVIELIERAEEVIALTHSRREEQVWEENAARLQQELTALKKENPGLFGELYLTFLNGIHPAIMKVSNPDRRAHFIADVVPEDRSKFATFEEGYYDYYFFFTRRSPEFDWLPNRDSTGISYGAILPKSVELALGMQANSSHWFTASMLLPGTRGKEIRRAVRVARIEFLGNHAQLLRLMERIKTGFGAALHKDVAYRARAFDNRWKIGRMGGEQLSDEGVSSTTRRGKPHPRLPMFQNLYKSGIPYQSPFGGLGGIKTHPAINMKNTTNPSTTLTGVEVFLNQREAAPEPESTINSVNSVEPTFSRLNGSSIPKVPFDLKRSLSGDLAIVNKNIINNQTLAGFGAESPSEKPSSKRSGEGGAKGQEGETFHEKGGLRSNDPGERLREFQRTLGIDHQSTRGEAMTKLKTGESVELHRLPKRSLRINADEIAGIVSIQVSARTLERKQRKTEFVAMRLENTDGKTRVWAKAKVVYSGVPFKENGEEEIFPNNKRYRFGTEFIQVQWKTDGPLYIGQRQADAHSQIAARFNSSPAPRGFGAADKQSLTLDEIMNGLDSENRARLEEISAEINKGYQLFHADGDSRLIDKYQLLVRQGKITLQHVAKLSRHDLNKESQERLTELIVPADLDEIFRYENALDRFSEYVKALPEEFVRYFGAVLLEYLYPTIGGEGAQPKLAIDRKLIIERYRAILDELFPDQIPAFTKARVFHAMDTRNLGTIERAVRLAELRLQKPDLKAAAVDLREFIEHGNYKGAVNFLAGRVDVFRVYLDYLVEANTGYQIILDQVRNLGAEGLPDSLQLLGTMIAVGSSFSKIPPGGLIRLIRTGLRNGYYERIVTLLVLMPRLGIAAGAIWTDEELRKRAVEKLVKAAEMLRGATNERVTGSVESVADEYFPVIKLLERLEQSEAGFGTKSDVFEPDPEMAAFIREGKVVEVFRDSVSGKFDAFKVKHADFYEPGKTERSAYRGERYPLTRLLGMSQKKSRIRFWHDRVSIRVVLGRTKLARVEEKDFSDIVRMNRRDNVIYVGERFFRFVFKEAPDANPMFNFLGGMIATFMEGRITSMIMGEKDQKTASIIRKVPEVIDRIWTPVWRKGDRIIYDEIPASIRTLLLNEDDDIMRMTWGILTHAWRVYPESLKNLVLDFMEEALARGNIEIRGSAWNFIHSNLNYFDDTRRLKLLRDSLLYIPPEAWPFLDENWNKLLPIDKSVLTPEFVRKSLTGKQLYNAPKTWNFLTKHWDELPDTVRHAITPDIISVSFESAYEAQSEHYKRIPIDASVRTFLDKHRSMLWNTVRPFVTEKRRDLLPAFRSAIKPEYLIPHLGDSVGNLFTHWEFLTDEWLRLPDSIRTHITLENIKEWLDHSGVDSRVWTFIGKNWDSLPKDIRKFASVELQRVLDEKDASKLAIAAGALGRINPAFEGVSPPAISAIAMTRPDWIENPPAGGEMGKFAEIIGWLPPVGGKIPVVFEAETGMQTEREGHGILMPTWTAEEQVEVILRMRQRDELKDGFVYQLTVQGKLPDDFKYVEFVLILASRYPHDWKNPFYDTPWGRANPLLHDGGNVEVGINPVWQNVPGRTDSLQHISLVHEPALEQIEEMADHEQLKLLGEDQTVLERTDQEKIERDHLYIGALAYQRLALALHAHEGTAPGEIPEPIREKLAIQWSMFKSKMDDLLEKYGLTEITGTPWFLEKPRKLRDWPGDRYEAPHEPVLKDLLQLERLRNARPDVKEEAFDLLAKSLEDIDRDLGLYPGESGFGAVLKEGKDFRYREYAVIDHLPVPFEVEVRITLPLGENRVVGRFRIISLEGSNNEVLVKAFGPLPEYKELLESRTRVNDFGNVTGILDTEIVGKRSIANVFREESSKGVKRYLNQRAQEAILNELNQRFLLVSYKVIVEESETKGQSVKLLVKNHHDPRNMLIEIDTAPMSIGDLRDTSRQKLASGESNKNSGFGASKENDAGAKLSRYGIRVEHDRISFLGVPGHLIGGEAGSWFMREIRSIETKPIAVELDHMPNVDLILPLEKWPLLGRSTHEVLLGTAKVNEEEQPAAIKKFRDRLGNTPDLDKILHELKRVQAFDRLGIGPRFYGVIRDPGNQIVGYAMQVVLGLYKGDSIGRDSAKWEDMQTIRSRMKDVGLAMHKDFMTTPKGRIIAIDAADAEPMPGDNEAAVKMETFISTLNGKDQGRAGFGAASIIIPDAEQAIRDGEITAEAILKAAEENPRTRIHLIFSEMESWEQAAEFIEAAFGPDAKAVFPLIEIHTAETIRRASQLSPSASSDRLKQSAVSRLSGLAQGAVVIIDTEEANAGNARKNVQHLFAYSDSARVHPQLLSNAIFLARLNGADAIDEAVSRGLQRVEENRWRDVLTVNPAVEILDQMARATKAFDVAA